MASVHDRENYYLADNAQEPRPEHNNNKALCLYNNDPKYGEIIQDLKTRLCAQQKAIEDQQNILNTQQKLIIDSQKTMDRGAFNLVLIDGDAMPFIDDLVTKGIKGGQEAAKALLRAVREEIRYEDDFRHEEKIVVKVYASLQGMSKTYTALGITHMVDDFADFVTGFNKLNEHCDFIDAGNAKAGADRKIRASLDLNLYNVHCKRIFLGACTDNEYASYLNSIYDIDTPSRVRLLKGPAFARDFKHILHQYQQLEFPAIFRGYKLPSTHDYSPPNRAVQPYYNYNRRVDSFDCGSGCSPWNNVEKDMRAGPVEAPDRGGAATRGGLRTRGGASEARGGAGATIRRPSPPSPRSIPPPNAAWLAKRSEQASKVYDEAAEAVKFDVSMERSVIGTGAALDAIKFGEV